VDLKGIAEPLNPTLRRRKGEMQNPGVNVWVG